MEISFKDIIKIIQKSLIFIILTALIFSVVSFFISNFFIQKTYTSKVKLYVETTMENSNSSSALNSISYAEALVSTYIQMLETNNFYSSVAEAIDDKYSASQLSGRISFSSIENTEVFEARVVASSPTDAKLIADAVATVAPSTIAHLNDNAELKIVDDPTIPSGPSSPNVKRNVLLAFGIGVALALVIAFVREYFDVKIKYNEDMTTICGVPVLAAIPDFENMKNLRSKDADTKEV